MCEEQYANSQNFFEGIHTNKCRGVFLNKAITTVVVTTTSILIHGTELFCVY